MAQGREIVTHAANSGRDLSICPTERMTTSSGELDHPTHFGSRIGARGSHEKVCSGIGCYSRHGELHGMRRNRERQGQGSAPDRADEGLKPCAPSASAFSCRRSRARIVDRIVAADKHGISSQELSDAIYRERNSHARDPISPNLIRTHIFPINSLLSETDVVIRAEPASGTFAGASCGEK
jgi:hypothetical protein